MASDKDVLDWAAALPKESFLRAHIELMVPTYESPALFMLGGGLATLACAAPENLAIQMGMDKICANLYIMNIGNSGAARKGPSTSVLRKYLTGDLSNRIMGNPGSFQAFEESLQLSPIGVLLYDDFAEFLGRSGHGGLLAPLKDLLMPLWDCTPHNPKYVGKEKGKGNIPNPRVNILTGVNLALLDAHTSDKDLGGGFFNRFITFTGESEKSVPFPPPINLEPLALQIHRLSKTNPKSRGVVLDGAAFVRYCNWYDKLKVIQKKLNPVEAGIASRLHTNLLKVAMLLMFDAGYYHKGPVFSIEEWAFEQAKWVVMQSLYSGLATVRQVAGTPFARKKRELYNATSTEWKFGGQIAADCSIHSLMKRETVDILETLVFEGRLEKEGSGDSAKYRRRE